MPPKLKVTKVVDVTNTKSSKDTAGIAIVALYIWHSKMQAAYFQKKIVERISMAANRINFPTFGAIPYEVQDLAL